ncbi:class I SAM-dependent methyltransferase [Streptomyces mirabilis]|uniref:class I SAM-dependent methyltransferase n=1 Tax=Streptomyces mirabilis TaxID=68239 RepID=UPI0036D7D22C
MPTVDMFADRYLSGDELWGDEFTQEQMEEWFADEREASAVLTGTTPSADTYRSHGINRLHGYRMLPAGRFEDALGVGSSFGGEFLPVLDRIGRITILEPSAQLRSKELRGVPLRYVDPSPTGDMPFSSGTFDLAVCFGSLHHIPNVTKVVRELGRVVKPGGWIIIREPVVSMGDWRSLDRPGLTKRERGIPRHLLESAMRNAGFSIKSSVFCYMPLSQRIGDLTSRNLYGSRVGALIDRALSISTAWNYRYHAVKPWQKLRPSSVSIVARRR